MESTTANHSVRWDASARLLLIVGAVVLCRLWILPLGNSFWLDETVIVTIVRNGFQTSVHQAFLDSQPVMFSIIEWLTRHLGESEIVLRLPSLLASIGSLIVLYRIGREAIDQDAGLLLAGIHLSLVAVAEQAANARPYAIALLLEYLSILWLLRWARRGQFRDGLLWMVFAVLATNLHHLFVTALGAEFLFAGIIALRRQAFPFRDFVWFELIGIAGVLPAVPQALLIASQAKLFAWAPTPTWIQLPIALVPVFLLAGVCVMAGVTRLNQDGPQWRRPEDGSLALLGALLLAPAVVFFLFAYFGTVNMFVDRYLLTTTPGCVLLFGWMLRGLEPTLVRRMSLIAALLIAGIVAGNDIGLAAVPDYSLQHWREAVASAPTSGGMLVYSGLVETRRVDWLQDPDHWSYMVSPVLTYRPNLSEHDTFLLPFEFGPADQAYVTALMDGTLHRYDTLTIIGVNFVSWQSWAEWLSDRLATAGYRKLRSVPYGNVQVDVFERER